jgi:hypothetical protein
MKTMNIGTTTLGDKEVVIWLHTSRDPLPEEWALGIDATVAVKRKHGIEKMRSFVVSDGGAPNATQRKQLGEIFDGKPNKLAVVTNSLSNPMKRAIATAITWINPAFIAVPPSKWREALQHLDLEREIAPLLEILRELQKDLPEVTSLIEFERASAAGTP